jgi:hypothetical protein
VKQQKYLRRLQIMTGKSKGASEGKKKPPFTVKAPKVAKVGVPALCKKCSKPYGTGPGKCKCGG